MPKTQVTIGNADYNLVVEDQRNIVQINSAEPNTVIVTVPGLSSAALKTSVLYGSGKPWLQVEV
jgi:hypothetical protein